MNGYTRGDCLKQYSREKYNYWVKIAQERLKAKPTKAEQLILDIYRVNGKKDIVFQKIIKIHKDKSYIADFYDPKTKTVIEIDGEYHSSTEQRKKDDIRNRKMLDKGYAIVRVKNKDILKYKFPPQLGITNKMIKCYKNQ